MGCVADFSTRSFLYVLAPNATEIQVLSIQKAGEGKNIETLNIAGPTKAAGLTISTCPISFQVPYVIFISFSQTLSTSRV